MRRILCSVILLMTLTGCSTDSLADRVYTRALGLSGKETLAFTLQAFEEEGCETYCAPGIPDAIRLAQADAGGRIFIGHTELLCINGTSDPALTEKLFYEEGLSPGCKVLFTAPDTFLRHADAAETVHSLRMAERDGLLASTDLASILEEWSGRWETALLPTPSSDGMRMILLRRDGTFRFLSEDAAAGLVWMRRHEGAFSFTFRDTEITVRKIRIERMADADGITVQIRIRSDCPEEIRDALTSQIRSQCAAAAAELTDARADVIGLQDTLDAAGLHPEDYPVIQTEIDIN